MKPFKKLSVIFPILFFSIQYSVLCQQTWQTYDSLRSLYQEKHRYDTALVYAEKALQSVKEKTGENDTLYAEMLNAVMQLNCNLSQFSKALNYLISEKLIRKNLHGEKHPKYASCSDWMGYVYLELGNYPESEKNYQEALIIRKEILGVNHPDYAQSLNVLGLYYRKTGNYVKAENLYLESLKIRKRVLGTKNSAYSESLNNLAVLYNLMGYFDKAEKLLIESLKICEENSGKNNNDYAQSLNNLALLYSDMGKYSEAEPLLNENLKIISQISGNKSSNYARGLNNLAILYSSMCNYEKAITLYTESVNLIREPLGTKHPNFISASYNLAMAYKNIGQFSKAEELYIELISISKNAIGNKHPLYTKCVNGLAVLYVQTKKYTKAEKLLMEVIEIRKEVLGIKHPDYAMCLYNIAGLYLLMNRYAQAENIYNQVLAIRKESIGALHPDYVNTLISLAYLFYIQNELKAAEPLFKEAINIADYNISQNFTFLSEREKELYYTKERVKYNKFYAFSLKNKQENQSIVKDVYNVTIRNKGLLLKSSTAMRISVLNSKDTLLITKYENWLSMKNEISKLYSTEISKRKKNPEELEKQANEIEKELVRSSQLFSDFDKLKKINWESVKNNLKPGEAAIEFIHFKCEQVNKDTVIDREGEPKQSTSGNDIASTPFRSDDSTVYCALLITPQSKQPEMIKLFEEKQILDILNIATGNSLNQVNNLYGTNENTKDSLYKLTWKPMEKYLDGIKTVYYSPDGILHKISLAALGKGKNIYLCDNINLRQVSSTGKVAMPENTLIDKSITACIIGGIDYSADSSVNSIWQFLPGTITELDAIKNNLSKNNISANSFSGKEATELKFKNMYYNDGNPPGILHIATHGFFFPDPEQKQGDKKEESIETGEVKFRGGNSGFGLWQFVKNKNPLMRSGLVLARANNVWNHKFAGEEEDGVLTALEVAQLDMRKTKLVVLSACETGLGDIRGSEGVYGLQRAFKMAGVKYIIMSLWQVPDKETSEFMETFYSKLLKIKDIRKSFNETQKEMRKKYDPYYWAAFVLIE